MMKKISILLFLIFTTLFIAQGRSVSLAKKNLEPVIISTGGSIKINDIIHFQLGQNIDGSFRYVQDLNNFNEPIKSSGSRTAMMKQPIKFFKEKDGVIYAFTKYFSVNLEAAIRSEEIKIIEQ